MKSKTFYITLTLSVSLILSMNSVAQTLGFGRNYNGQIGIGNTTDQPLPIAVSFLPNVTGISGGELHTLFLKADGTLSASGANGYFQLGDGTIIIQREFPFPVLNLTNIIQVTGGQYYSAALRADGTVWSWGYNQNGEMGNGTSGLPSAIVQSSVSDVVQISAGDHHTLALKADGTVWAWGNNFSGQLGDNSSVHRSSPVQVGLGVKGFENIIAVSAGGFHSVALKSDGTVWCWGTGGALLGNGSSSVNLQMFPVKNTTLSNIVQISAGHDHNTALKSDGTVWVWGSNNYGQIGNGATFGTQLIPAQNTNPNIRNIIEIVAGGGDSTWVRRRDGTVWAWGASYGGQIGNGSFGQSNCFCQPMPAQTLVGANNAAIGAGYKHAYALKPVIPVPTGMNQKLRGSNLSFTFSNITAAGDVSYIGIDPTTTGLNIPQGYAVLDNQPAYDISKTAQTSGNITVCIRVNETNHANYPFLKILQEQNRDLIDVTTGFSTAFKNLCGKVTSFSRFVVAQGVEETKVTVAGKVTDGYRGIADAIVSLTDSSGDTRTVRTNSFGYYSFENIKIGQRYTFNVSTRRYNFAPQVIVINEETGNLDFTAQ